ncbi:hypothetical protein JTB14_031416 [Gonioctena quinquepunctata]|nr:hypothetical protein JTB14_031416 [Gonioctena quinquepunctata]
MDTSQNEDLEEKKNIDAEENWDNHNYSTYVPDLTRDILRQPPIEKTISLSAITYKSRFEAYDSSVSTIVHCCVLVSSHPHPPENMECDERFIMELQSKYKNGTPLSEFSEAELIISYFPMDFHSADMDMTMDSGEDFVVAELMKSKRQLREITKALEIQQQLLRLIVQMNLQALNNSPIIAERVNSATVRNLPKVIPQPIEGGRIVKSKFGENQSYWN